MILQTRALSNTGIAFGGGLGLGQGEATAYDSVLRDCSASAGAGGLGGSVGVREDALLALNNVSLEASSASTAGLAIHAPRIT